MSPRHSGDFLPPLKAVHGCLSIQCAVGRAVARLLYNTGSLYYDADGNGAGAAQIVATFQGNPALTATDITII